MKILKSLSLGSAVLTATAVLMGCSALRTQPQVLGNLSNVPQAAGERELFSLGIAPIQSRHDRQASWVSAAANTYASLLFVSDASTDDVYAFSLPNLIHVETLTGFNLPQGVCSDRQGNIWIATTNTSQLFKYSRSGKLLKTVTDTAGYPATCAIDPTSGDLAVTNLLDFNNAPGTVLIYKDAQGIPKSYGGGNLYELFFDGYDSNGNLYVDGCSKKICPQGGVFQLAELPKGAGKMQAIEISGGTIHYPAMVQWRSKADDLLVGDQECDGIIYSACVYEVSTSGSGGTIAGKIKLNNATGGRACDVPYAALTSTEDTFAGGDIEWSSSQCPSFTKSGTYRWRLPSGANPTNSNTGSGQVTPIQAAISNE